MDNILNISLRYSSTLLIGIYGVISLASADQALATFTSRPGFNGMMHFYYGLTINQYGGLNTIIAVASFYLLFYQVKVFIKFDFRRFITSLIIFTLFLISLYVIDFYLESIYTPKG